MPNHMDEIAHLLDEYAVLAESTENRSRLGQWQPEVCARDQWHGRPLPLAFRDSGQVPLQIDVQHTFFTQIYPQDLTEFYQDPASYLRFYLAKRIWAFRSIADDTPLDGVIPIYCSTPFETSLFGMGYHFYPDKDPLIDQSRPMVRSLDDVDRLPPIDFYSSGLMPQAHRLYQGVRELVGDRLKVVFSEWLRGPFGVALYLRGYQELLVDLVEGAELGRRLMSRVTQERQNWFRERAAFLGEPIGPGSIFNDEVDAGVIGPAHYRHHILPHEQALAEFHGSISYWHSCGNTAPMAPDVTAQGRVTLLDVSGWTDIEKVLPRIDSRRQSLEVRFNPVKDLQDATPEQMDAVIRRKLAACRRHDVSAFTLRVSGIQPWRNPDADVAQVNAWLDLARRAVEWLNTDQEAQSP